MHYIFLCIWKLYTKYKRIKRMRMQNEIMEICTCRKATSTYFMYEIENNFTHLEGKKAKI